MNDQTISQDSTAQMGVGDYMTKFRKMPKEEAAGFIAGEEEKAKIAKEGVGKAEKQAESKLIQQYGPSLYSKPMEEFKPSQETLSGFAALGSLMMVAGTMMGSKGRLAGIGAMNNIAGMLKGYQSGRKDLYEQERQQFEENMKVQERNRADIKEAFNLALKMAPTNLRGAEEFLNKTFASKGMSVPQAMLKSSGVMHTIDVVGGALDKANTTSNQIAKTIGPAERIAIAQYGAEQTAQSEAQKAARQKLLDESLIAEREATRSKTEAETQSKKDAAVRKGLSEQEYNTALALSKNPENITTEQERDLVAALTGTVYPVNKQPKADEVVGQRKFVKGIIGDEAKDLSAKELAKVASTIEASKLSFDLADAVQKTPEAAGVIGRTLSWFDKLRVSPTDEANPDILAAQAASDPTLFEGVPQDKISEVQNIQKIVVDVINARALAASGGSRMLISEFNAQKGVLGLQNLSPTSAPYVYRSLGTRDVKNLRQYGLSDDAIKKIIDSSQPRPKPSTSAGSIPAGLPENSQLIGKSSNGKSYVYQSPDGKKYAVPIEAQ